MHGRGIAILAGLLAAAVALYIAFLMAGGGLEAPLFCSLLLPIVYPLVFYRFVETLHFDNLSVHAEVVLALLAVLADGFLFFNSYIEHPGRSATIFRSEIAQFWLVIWIVWQVVVLLTLVVKLRERRRSGADG